MSDNVVGSVQAKHCKYCDRETVHEMNPSSKWICLSCGESND